MAFNYLKGTAITCLLLLFCFMGEASSQTLPEPDSFAFEFMRLQKYDENLADTLTGKAIFFSGKLYLNVHQPVNQIIFINGTDMKVYYPESNKGYHITSKSSFDLPIVNSLIASIHDDYGMTRIGFEIQSSSVSGDTLITQWEHERGSEAGIFKVYYVDDFIAKSSFETGNNILIVTNLEDYKSFGNFSLPTHIITERRSEQDASVEHLHVNEIVIDPEIPGNIRNFTFPENSSIDTSRF